MTPALCTDASALAPPDTDWALEADAITVAGGFRPALSELTLRLPTGAVLGLVGCNGAGKSTLLRCLVGLGAPARGQCRLLGQPALQLQDAQRERLGYVAQAPDLFGHLDALAHFQSLGHLYRGWDDQRALALARLLSLPLDVKAAQLSPGEQQKLSLVLALGHDPDLLILDEPMASLDPLTRRDVMRALFERAPHRADRSIVISSHLLSDLERVVSHVAFLRDGRLQLMGAWDDLAEQVRRIPLSAAELGQLPARSLLRLPGAAAARQPVLVDTRHAPALATEGRALSLDELFMDLNS
ncbi:ATP-binding cassette domain-containing protein [Aquabacterium sp. OR-4]|uniref:ATP-binding cassette domain-containing protein n=1 Tax=Aquabacterium sp. OR-4 TaxID=2978127 RepID=UPI0021B3B7F9|nr:ABC transporter ATP-binding protein [Aquabacterium sp. OR-4]MDT7834542.1 ABC transporter ATP-binding protein [Aquabacterium sp. OR-4]